MVQLVKEKKVKTEGMILVAKDAEGHVDHTGDHLGRKGMGWGGGVGISSGWRLRPCWRPPSGPPPAASWASSRRTRSTAAWRAA